MRRDYIIPFGLYYFVVHQLLCQDTNYSKKQLDRTWGMERAVCVKSQTAST